MHGHFNIVDVQIHHVPADVAAGLQQQQQPLVQQLPNGVMMMMMAPVLVDELPPPANAGGAADAQQQQQQPQAAGNALQQEQQQGFMHNLLGLGGNNVLPQMMLGGMAATDAGEHIAPTKLSAEDLPPGLRQLHLVNVGFKSSKVPLPCAKLQHLQIERCKAARAFRIPDLTR